MPVAFLVEWQSFATNFAMPLEDANATKRCQHFRVPDELGASVISGSSEYLLGRPIVIGVVYEFTPLLSPGTSLSSMLHRPPIP
jgi:hypothetical protein